MENNMTAIEIYSQINNLAKDPKTGYYVVDELIQAYYYEYRVPKMIIYIQEIFECDEDTAKEVFEIFKKENAQHLLTPVQAAVNQSAWESDRLAQQNKPKCPTCGSCNHKKISTTSKVANTVMFGIFGTKRHKTFHCNNCGYEW